MLKKTLTLTLVSLTLSLSANAAILSVDSAFGIDTITRDTATGLDWLDVTESRGLSYNQVTAQMGAGGTYDGYRYATMAELDQLIINFGYSAINTSCPDTALHCDPGTPGDSIVVEQMILTLGDTWDAYMDEQGVAYTQDVRASGAGSTSGLLGTQHLRDDSYDAALIYDGELVYRATGAQYDDFDDRVETAYSSAGRTSESLHRGSFLVQEVPVPAAGWLFISALVGLVGKKRLSRR